MPSPPIPGSLPIRRVDEQGIVHPIGAYDTERRVLHLEAPGFPFLGPGAHAVDGDLPWIFHDMAPDGFLAPSFARWFPELGLPPARERWTSRHILTLLSCCGHDLPGDLLIGEETWQRHQRIFGRGTLPGPARQGTRETYPGLIENLQRGEGDGSSLGGQRPKFTLRLQSGEGLLVKLTPPLNEPLGQRWADLLRMEAHCAATLNEHGLRAAQGTYLELEERGYLELDRFDRLPGGGRRSVATLYWLGIARYQEAQDPEAITRQLAAEGDLGAEDARRLGRVHAFSQAIGNTDAHLGNYALFPKAQGPATLAPFYDITPMVLAPRALGLPDSRLQPRRQAIPSGIEPLVETLVAKARGDSGISSEFLDLWLKYIGRA